MNLYRRSPDRVSGLIAIPSETRDVAAMVHDLHTLGIAPHAISVVGRVDESAKKALAQHDDPAPREARNALGATSALLEPTARFETFGSAAGALAGVLAGFVALALPGSGMLWFAGGVELLLAEEAAGGLVGMGLGALMGVWFGQRIVEEHEDLYASELKAGRVLLVVRGEPAFIRLAEAHLRTFSLAHLDKI